MKTQRWKKNDFNDNLSMQKKSYLYIGHALIAFLYYLFIIYRLNLEDQLFVYYDLGYCNMVVFRQFDP